jgi:hypothetical protein
VSLFAARGSGSLSCLRSMTLGSEGGAHPVRALLVRCGSRLASKRARWCGSRDPVDLDRRGVASSARPGTSPSGFGLASQRAGRSSRLAWQGCPGTSSSRVCVPRDSNPRLVAGRRPHSWCPRRGSPRGKFEKPTVQVAPGRVPWASGPRRRSHYPGRARPGTTSMRLPIQVRRDSCSAGKPPSRPGASSLAPRAPSAVTLP